MCEACVNHAIKINYFIFILFKIYEIYESHLQIYNYKTNIHIHFKIKLNDIHKKIIKIFMIILI